MTLTHQVLEYRIEYTRGTFTPITLQYNTRIMKVDFTHIEKEVKKALLKYQWEFIDSKYDKENFGNWIIEFKNSSYKLRLVN
mgnify:CR=1 FL=1